jgi:uncharacterized protein YerC
MRKSSQLLNSSFKRQLEKTFFQLISDLKEVSDIELFFSDFLTDTEMSVFTKRLAIAYWLKKGRSYQNIKRNLKVSSATIASVQSQMNKQGYKKAVKNLEAEEWANVWTQRIKKVIK